MRVNPEQGILLASGEPELLTRAEGVLRASGAGVREELTAEAALQSLLDKPPALALVDARLPGMELGRLLAGVRRDGVARFPIVLITDTLSEELKNRLDEGVIDDLAPAHLEPEWLLLRVEQALRHFEHSRELDHLREQLLLDAERDPQTGALKRQAILGFLFRETDRAQRMNTALSVILFDIDDFGHWNSRLGTAACDHLLAKVAERVGRLLRSYDLLGRVGKDEFLVALPGCSAVNAGLLAERMRTEIFAEPFQAGERKVRLSACFSVVPCRGRSPVVVLREAEEMLRIAKADGPETIQCAAEFARGDLNPQTVRTKEG